MFFDEEGDITISQSGDIFLTQTSWRDDVQQAYIRIMTDVGDYLLYPDLGANLSNMFGMPQSSDTGKYGVALISGALDRDGRFAGKPFTVKAVPVSSQAIRFDVFIQSGSSDQVRLSVEQSLGISSSPDEPLILSGWGHEEEGWGHGPWGE